MQAYYLLENRGLIEARPRSGYFVRARLGHKLSEPGMTQPESGSTRLQVSDFIFQILESVRDPLIVPLGSGFPCPRLYPLDKLGRFLAGSARKFAPQDTLTGLPPGHEELRRQLALRYLAQGAAVSPQEIVITSGAMEGLNLPNNLKASAAKRMEQGLVQNIDMPLSSIGTMASEVTSVVSATTQIAKQILNMSLSQVKVHLKANYQMYIQEETKESKLKRQAVQAELQRLYEEMAQQEPVKSHPLQTLIDKL